MKRRLPWITGFMILTLVTGCMNAGISPQPDAMEQQEQQENPILATVQPEEDPSQGVNEAEPSGTPSQEKEPVPDMLAGDLSPDGEQEAASEDGEELEACKQAILDRGLILPEKGYVDYQSGLRIFPLLYFILTKESIPATRSGEEVYMLDNPIFVTKHENFADALVFAPVHSQRTGAIHGIPGTPRNAVTEYYADMVYGPFPQHLATDVGPTNKSVPVTRATWVNELAEYTEPCEGVLQLPPAQDEPSAFDTSGAMFPFAEEIDFIAGQSRVGFSLIQNGTAYHMEDNKINQIQIPVLLYCPGCDADSVEMLQDGAKLSFQTDPYDDLWKEWLGEDWHAFTSDKVGFDEDLFMEAKLDQIDSDSPPFISENPSTIEVTIEGETVSFFNH